MDASGYDFDEFRSIIAAQYRGIDLVRVPVLERCLQASVSFPIGSVVLTEAALISGKIGGLYAKKVLREDVAALEDDDGIHANSVLVDCIGCILLHSHDARRRVATLCQAETDSTEVGEELYASLRDEYKEAISLATLSSYIKSLSANCFSASDGVDLLFVGSMFEHSCMANVFTGDVDKGTLRSFRAIQNIEPGTRLSIDYLMLPHTYAPTEDRRAALLPWGFKCNCIRCMNPEERVRCFACPVCDGELYAGTWRCACGFTADEKKIAEFVAVETRLVEDWEKNGTTWRSIIASPGPLKKWHYLVFRDAWAERAWYGHNTTSDVLDYLLGAISWFYDYMNGLHPEMIDFAHDLAERTCVAQVQQNNNLELQRGYLETENRCLQTFFPELSKQADDEILKLLGMSEFGTTEGETQQACGDAEFSAPKTSDSQEEPCASRTEHVPVETEWLDVCATRYDISAQNVGEPAQHRSISGSPSSVDTVHALSNWIKVEPSTASLGTQAEEKCAVQAATRLVYGVPTPAGKENPARGYEACPELDDIPACLGVDIVADEGIPSAPSPYSTAEEISLHEQKMRQVALHFEEMD